jgi:hypothetical protein
MTTALTVALLAGALGAVDPPSSRGSLSVAYLWLHDHEQQAAYASGLSLSTAHRIRGWLALAAEVSRSNRSEDFRNTEGGLFELRYESLKGGPRVSRWVGRVRPYGQVLAGATRWRIRERIDPRGRESLSWESATHFALTPGAGLDVFIVRRVSLRVSGDLSFVFRRDNRFGNAYRTKISTVHGGMAFHWGGR